MKRKVLVSGAEYWDFNQEPRFTGYFVSNHMDDKGKLIGFDFLDEQQEKWIISNSHSIDKALELTGYDSETLVEIIFKGKIIVKSTGKPFNKFEVAVLEEETPEPVTEEAKDKATKKK
jgi:hypothetical protein